MNRVIGRRYVVGTQLISPTGSVAASAVTAVLGIRDIQ